MGRRVAWIALAVVVAAGATAGTVALTRSMTQVSPQPAAEVNGEIITRQQVEEDLGLIARQYRMTFEGDDGAKARREVTAVVLDQLIERALIMQEARRRGLVAGDGEVDKQIAEIRARFPTPRDFVATMEERGLTLASLRERLRVDLTVRKLVPAVAGEVTVSEAALRAQYEKDKARYAETEQVRARHILVGSEREAKFVLSLLRRGRPFAELAKQYSTDPGSKDQGGELGWLGRGQTVAEFEKAAFSAKIGEVTEPVKSEFGYHIILVEERKPASQKTFEQVRDEIRQQLVAQEQEQRFQAWVQEIKKKAKIEKFV